MPRGDARVLRSRGEAAPRVLIAKQGARVAVRWADLGRAAHRTLHEIRGIRTWRRVERASVEGAWGETGQQGLAWFDANGGPVVGGLTLR